jgi:hypothetical protein
MTAKNTFKNAGNAPTCGAWASADVVKSDSVALAHVARAIWVGGAGDLTIKDPYGTVSTYHNVPAGTRIDCFCTHVMAATTATLMTAMF